MNKFVGYVEGADRRPTAPVLTVLSGLPGAGKTTYARAYVATTGAVLVGRDELRAALVSLDCEGTITALMCDLARAILRTGRSVIVDAWNLHPADRTAWQLLAAETEARLAWVHLTTPVDECVRRDATRPAPNGEARVRSAAREFARSIEVLEAVARS